MTTTAAVQIALIKEVEARILALKSNRPVKQDAPFMLHEDDDNPITEMTGRNRLFRIGTFERVQNWHHGYTQQGVLYHAPITFVYSRGRIWSAAALDDMHQIAFDLLVHQPSVDGVAQRYILQGPPMVTKTEHATERWDYYTVTMECWLNVTAT